MALLHRGAVYALGTPSTVITEENIRRVYETTVMVEKNPISGAPRVTPVGKARGWKKPSRDRTIHIICGEGSGVDSGPAPAAPGIPGFPGRVEYR